MEQLNGMAICAGGGGLELGLRLAFGSRYRCLLYVEREIAAAAVLVQGMEAGVLDTAPVWDDLESVPFDLYRGRVDIISGGIPCQPFSTAGKRLGEHDTRNLWPHTARLVFEVAPSIVFIENVPNILPYYHRVIRPDLQALGYEVKEGIFSAEEVGAPHLRERLFILAHRKGHGSRFLESISFRRASARFVDSRPQLADAGHGAGSAEHGQQQAQRAAVVGRGGDVVADAGDGRFQEQGRGQGGGAGARPAGADVGDSNSETRGLASGREQTYAAPFPPGPGDADGWRAYIESGGPAPVTTRAESRVRQRADGLARADWLRIYGNGCVPATVAVAFLELAKEAGL